MHHNRNNLCDRPQVKRYIPGMGTTGMGAPSALYLGLSVRIGYLPMLLGRHIITAITSIIIQTSMNTVMPQITAQSGDRLVGWKNKNVFISCMFLANLLLCGMFNTHVMSGHCGRQEIDT